MAKPIGPFNLTSTYLRLRTDSRVDPLPVNADFWPRLMSGAIEFRSHDRLVTMSSFGEPWKNAEMHPSGDEVVCLVSGGPVTFVLFDADGGERHVDLADAGAYVLVPTGTWHTARTSALATMLFITAGEGTQHRPLK